MPYGVNPITGRPGPAPHPARDGDRVQARQRVNRQVSQGVRPHPNTLACVDCGHEYRLGERRHEYDHHLGYGAAHHEDVEPVCTLCHHARDSAKKNAKACIRGHEFTADNTHTAANGTRHCRACARLREKARGPRGSAYWAKVNAKRRNHRDGTDENRVG